MKLRLIALIAGATLFVGAPLWGQEKAKPAAPQKAAVKTATLTGKMKLALELGEQMLNHVKSIFGIIGENSKNCDTAIKSVKAYVTKNEKSVRDLLAKLKKMEKEFSDEEKQALTNIMTDKSKAMMSESMGAMMSFSQNCPQQAGQLGQALSIFSDSEMKQEKSPATH
ncbi:MAG TPA: hypothetical protein VM425_07905 [Myxococcota bacterium]|nr:hypothetical protein [Myxococcota bacterium]